MVDVAAPAVLAADAAHLAATAAGTAYPIVFPFAMELVVVVLFAVVGFPIWIALRVIDSVREARLRNDRRT